MDQGLGVSFATSVLGELTLESFSFPSLVHSASPLSKSQLFCLLLAKCQANHLFVFCFSSQFKTTELLVFSEPFLSTGEQQELHIPALPQCPIQAQLCWKPSWLPSPRSCLLSFATKQSCAGKYHSAQWPFQLWAWTCWVSHSAHPSAFCLCWNCDRSAGYG